jgi:thiol-disulfide isomerase/thioredoxin
MGFSPAFDYLKKYVVILILFLGITASSQSYKIKVNIKGYTNDTLLLGYHFGDKQYIKDTAYRTKEGFVFSKDTALEPGMYLVVVQPSHDFFQLLIDSGKQNFSIETTLDKLSENLKFKGSKLNEDFVKYIDYISDHRAKADSLTALNKTETDSLKKLILKKQLDQLDQEVKNKQTEILKEQPKSILSLIIKWSLEVDIPDFSQVTSKEKDLIIFNYYKKHFFDYAEFNDDRSVRIPLFYQKVDQYIQKLTMQHPDSINVSLDTILSRCKVVDSEVHKFLLSHYLNYFANSKFVGMDGVYVHLVEEYYAKGRAPWLDKENLAKMTADAKVLKPLLIDRVAPNIKVFRKDSTPIQLHDIKSPYLVLVFWAPDCGHCKKAMPLIKDFYDKFNTKGVEILAVCTKVGPEEKTCWDGVKDLKMENWINASDPSHSSRFKAIYDLKTTPQIYILDKNKKILTKKIGAEQLPEVMDKLLNIKENE